MTIELAPHQQRVVDEKAELDGKLSRLRSFVQSPMFATLPGADNCLLTEQQTHMARYSSVLGQRIALFLGAEAEQANDDINYHSTPVRDFHLAFGHPISTDPRHGPTVEQRVLRVQMLATELVELARAFGVGLKIDSESSPNEDECVAVVSIDRPYNPAEAADALGDLRYLVDGGNLICGFPGERVLAEIHRSNMSKLGADGQPVRREDGKILKGPNYFKPDIRGVLGLPSAPIPAPAECRCAADNRPTDRPCPHGLICT